MTFSCVVTPLKGRAYEERLVAVEDRQCPPACVDQLASQGADLVIVLDGIRVPGQLALLDDVPPNFVLLVQLAQLLLRYPVAGKSPVEEHTAACLRESSPRQQRVSRGEESDVLRLEWQLRFLGGLLDHSTQIRARVKMGVDWLIRTSEVSASVRNAVCRRAAPDSRSGWSRLRSSRTRSTSGTLLRAGCCGTWR